LDLKLIYGRYILNSIIFKFERWKSDASLLSNVWRSFKDCRWKYE